MVLLADEVMNQGVGTWEKLLEVGLVGVLEHVVAAVVKPVLEVVESLAEHILLVVESLEGMLVVVYALEEHVSRVVAPWVEVFLVVAAGMFQVVPVLVVVLPVGGSLNRVEGTLWEVKMEEVH